MDDAKPLSSSTEEKKNVNGEDSASDKEVKKEAPKTPKKDKDKTTTIQKQVKKTPPKKEESSEEEEHKAVADSGKEEDEEEEEASDEDEEDERDKKVALLDQPLEVSGSRERKKVDRLNLSFAMPSKEKKTDIPEGEGERLGDCPRIEFRIQKSKANELKYLHNILFNRPGSTTEVKKNIRLFNGFTFKKDSAEYERKKTHLDRLKLSTINKVMYILDMERPKTKEEMVTKIIEFLINPQPSGKKLRLSKKKSKQTRQKSSPSDKKAGKVMAPRAVKSQVKSDDSKSDSVSNSSNEEVESEEDSEEEWKATRKETKSKKTAVKKESSVKEEVTKEPKRSLKPPPKRKRMIDSSDSSDDEPLVKKTKEPPSDDEIKALIKKILDGANLEEITMKTVCKQVYAAYPEFDLSERKNFIKDTVRSIIS